VDRRRIQVAAMTLAVDVDTAEVVRALRGKGVEPVLLKGPALGRLLHPGAGLRPYSDIDLMVAPDDLARTEATLDELGYAPDPPPLPPEPPRRHATSWRQPGRTAVDLHQCLHFVAAPAERTWELVRRDAATIDVAGTPVLAPGCGMLAMHLALHAAVSGHDTPRILEDLERAVATLPRPVWHNARALAAELDVLGSFGGGLAMCPAGANLAEELGVPSGGTRPMRLAWATTRHARPRTIDLIVALPSLRAKVAAIACRCFPPAAHVRPLGGRDGPIWLALGYVVRLGRIARQLPGSLVVWARLSQRLPPNP
jgi:hypothetical protein